ncbi:hypothetical protein ACVNPS_02840 [Candidatus Bipolaricaulota sp. J31]
MTRESIAELIRRGGSKYKRTCRKEKGRILDELEQPTGYHRAPRSPFIYKNVVGIAASRCEPVAIRNRRWEEMPRPRRE